MEAGLKPPGSLWGQCKQEQCPWLLSCQRQQLLALPPEYGLEGHGRQAMGEQRESSQALRFAIVTFLPLRDSLPHPWDPVILEGRAPGLELPYAVPAPPRSSMGLLKEISSLAVLGNIFF